LPERGVVMELTGQVTAYKGRNFLLPTIAPRLVGFEASPAPSTQPETVPGAAEHEGEGGGASEIGTQSASEAEQQLQRALSGLSQAATAASDLAGDVPATDVEEMTVDAAALASPSEGTILAARRGTIARDSGGAWVFAFDADAEGSADPPLVLLPCLMLERMESYARLMGAHAPVLLSGRVFRYEGRGYILPSAFRIPAEHSRIQP
jgi:hypothetical protein